MPEEERIINISGEELEIPKLPAFKRLVVLPNYAPTESLPSGCVAVFDKSHDIEPRYLGRDAGCGMLLAKFESPLKNLEEIVGNVGSFVYERYSGLGNLGDNGHFITFYCVTDTHDARFCRGANLVLIHSGSGGRGIELFNSGLLGRGLLNEQRRCMSYARRNRMALLNKIRKIISNNKAEIIFDNPHNYVEIRQDSIIYRRGAVKLREDELSVIPSSIGGDGIIVSPTKHIFRLEQSIPHATGRKIPISLANEQEFFLDGFPNNIYIPYFISPENLNSELPPNYNSMGGIIPKIEEYVTILARITPKASIMK